MYKEREDLMQNDLGFLTAVAVASSAVTGWIARVFTLGVLGRLKNVEHDVSQVRESCIKGDDLSQFENRLMDTINTNTTEIKNDITNAGKRVDDLYTIMSQRD